jgi:hypothetical protein
LAARTLLAKLAARGLIPLPPPRRSTARKHPYPPEVVSDPPAQTITDALAALQPLRLERVDALAQRRRVRHLLARHYNRGFGGAVGENVQYVAYDARGRGLAVLVFGAAAWKVAFRDRFIGWSPSQRAARLSRLTNQQRFLILSWVRVPHLASHLWAQATRRLSQDWQHRYGHPVWLVESFVEVQRFAGTSYKAAGWHCLGLTTGRTRQDRHHQLQGSLKSIWVQPLHPRFRSLLSAP